MSRIDLGFSQRLEFLPRFVGLHVLLVESDVVPGVIHEAEELVEAMKGGEFLRTTVEVGLADLGGGITSFGKEFGQGDLFLW